MSKSKIIKATDEILDADITNLDLGPKGISEKLAKKGVIKKSQINETANFLSKEMKKQGFYAKGGKVSKVQWKEMDLDEFETFLDNTYRRYVDYMIERKHWKNEKGDYTNVLDKVIKTHYDLADYIEEDTKKAEEKGVDYSPINMDWIKKGVDKEGEDIYDIEVVFPEADDEHRFIKVKDVVSYEDTDERLSDYFTSWDAVYDGYDEDEEEDYAKGGYIRLSDNNVDEIEKTLEKILDTNVISDTNDIDASEFYIANGEFVVGVSKEKNYSFSIYRDGYPPIDSGKANTFNDLLKEISKAVKKHKKSLLQKQDYAKGGKVLDTDSYGKITISNATLSLNDFDLVEGIEIKGDDIEFTEIQGYYDLDDLTKGEVEDLIKKYEGNILYESDEEYAKGGNLPKFDGKEYIRVSYYGGSGPYPYTEWLEDRIGDNLYKGTPYSPGALQRIKKELKNKGFNIKNEVRKLEDKPLTEEERKQRYYDESQEYYSLLRKLINFRNQNYAKDDKVNNNLVKKITNQILKDLDPSALEEPAYLDDTITDYINVNTNLPESSNEFMDIYYEVEKGVKGGLGDVRYKTKYAKGGYTSQNPPMSNEVYMELDRIKDWKIIKEKKHPSKRTNAVFTHSVAKDKDLYFGSGDFYRNALMIDGKIKYPIYFTKKDEAEKDFNSHYKEFAKGGLTKGDFEKDNIEFIYSRDYNAYYLIIEDKLGDYDVYEMDSFSLDDGGYIKYQKLTLNDKIDFDERFYGVNKRYDDLSDDLKIKIKKAIDGTWEDYAKGGDLDKEFKFDSNFIIYVPSTSDVSSQISKDELNSRVEEVKEFVSNHFGGYTETQADGGYKSDSGDVVEEDVVKVSVFAKEKDWENRENLIVAQVKEWANKWGQEAIGFEYEDADGKRKLYYIDRDGKKGFGGFLFGTAIGGYAGYKYGLTKDKRDRADLFRTEQKYYGRAKSKYQDYKDRKRKGGPDIVDVDYEEFAKGGKLSEDEFRDGIGNTAFQLVEEGGGSAKLGEYVEEGIQNYVDKFYAKGGNLPVDVKVYSNDKGIYTIVDADSVFEMTDDFKGKYIGELTDFPSDITHWGKMIDIKEMSKPMQRGISQLKKI